MGWGRWGGVVWVVGGGVVCFWFVWGCVWCFVGVWWVRVGGLCFGWWVGVGGGWFVGEEWKNVSGFVCVLFFCFVFGKEEE